MKLQKPAVAAKAIELGLPFHQPQKIRTAEFFESISAFKPDIALVVAYGRILPAPLLAIPKHGFLNVHGSILPKYRGAAPMQRAIEAGETITGTTIMQVDEQLDHGPVFAIDKIDIGPDERLPSVAHRLAQTGAAAMTRVLQQIASGSITSTPQDDSVATLAAKIEKAEGRTDFNEAAGKIYDRFRAFDPWPGVYFDSAGESIKIVEMNRSTLRGQPGQVLALDDAVTVATSDGSLRLVTLQRPGKARASAGDVARGLGWRVGALLP